MSMFADAKISSLGYLWSLQLHWGNGPTHHIIYSHFSGTVISLVNIGNVINTTDLKVNNVVNGNRLVLVGSSRLQLGNQEK